MSPWLDQYYIPIQKFINSLTPGRFQFNYRYVIFKLTLVNGHWGISYEIALRWLPLDLTDDKSTLVLVMAWCRQATSHYLSQFWPRSMSPNGVTRPQWVNPPTSWNCNILSKLGPYHCCWCTGSLYHQTISNHPVPEKKVFLIPSLQALADVMAWHWIGSTADLWIYVQRMT